MPNDAEHDEHDEHDEWPHDDKPTASETGSRVDNTDDPVRMYLMQMGQIPLLKRAEEIGAAREIEADPDPLPALHAGHRLRLARRRAGVAAGV